MTVIGSFQQLQSIFSIIIPIVLLHVYSLAKIWATNNMSKLLVRFPVAWNA